MLYLKVKIPIIFAIRYYIRRQRSIRTGYSTTRVISETERILNWIATFILALFPVLFFGFFLLSETGYNDNPLASLGYGAILSGICFAIGVILLQLGLEE